MILTIAGKLPSRIKPVIEKYFAAPKPKEIVLNPFVEPLQTHVEVQKKLPTKSSYLVLGFKLPPLGSKQALIFDIFDGVIGKGQSGRLFNEVRNKRGLAYSVGVYHNKGFSYNFFALYANLQKRNLAKVKAIFLTELSRLKRLSLADLKAAKLYLEGDFLIRNEDNLQWAQSLTQWELASQNLNYLNRLKSIKLKDTRALARQMFNENYCMSVIVPDKPA